MTRVSRNKRPAVSKPASRTKAAKKKPAEKASKPKDIVWRPVGEHNPRVSEARSREIDNAIDSALSGRSNWGFGGGGGGSR